jgi:mRNA interferase MazF
VKARYVPRAGDLIWLDFDPQAGREQAGGRPALVLSPLNYNAKSGLAIVCPVTGQKKGYPFEVDLPAGTRIGGTILSDHLRSIDWGQRHADLAGKVSPDVLKAVQERISLLLGFASSSG